MKRIVWPVSAIACLLVCLCASRVCGAMAEWTVMVYLDGDNDLETNAVDDFSEMAKVGSTAAVNILVQFDRRSGYDVRYGNWTDTQRFRVTAGMTPSVAYAVANWGDGAGGREVNMGDPAVLRSFVLWGMQNYPAQKYALILWDHGSGWKYLQYQLLAEKASYEGLAGEEKERSAARIRELERRIFSRRILKSVCYDDTSGDELTIRENREALEGLPARVDIVGFDACLMGMVEVGYELRNVADIMVASEETELRTGWPFDTVCGDVVANPGISPAAFASAMVTRYGQYYGAGGGDTLSAVDLSRMVALADALDNFAQTVTANGRQWLAVNSALQGTTSFSDDDYRDLKVFLTRLENLASAGDVVSAVQNVLEILDMCVLANFGAPSAQGLSIYFPSHGSGVDSRYALPSIRFAETFWDEFLVAFAASNLTEGFITLFQEDFSAGLPAGWTVVDGYSDGYTWTSGNPGHLSPSGLTAPFMSVDSYWAGKRYMNEQLVTSALDLSGSPRVFLKFDHSFVPWASEKADVGLRVNGGDWQTLLTFQYARAGGTVLLDISALAAGSSSAQVRWHYHNAYYAEYWAVDNVAVLAADPDRGDPNASGARDVGDAMLGLRASLEMPVKVGLSSYPFPYPDWFRTAADMDDDGDIDIHDVMLLLKGALGLN